MGLYGERVGCLSFCCKDEKEALKVQQASKLIARTMWNRPAKYGSLVAKKILNNSTHRKTWVQDVEGVVRRINSMR